MNATEFKEKYYEDDEIYGDNVKCIVAGDSIAEYKSVLTTNVYEVTLPDGSVEYFEVTFSRSNSGYWSDSESDEPEFHKVTPIKKIVEITEWARE